METQVFLSNRQLETAKINNRTKMLDVYQNLLLADTSRMDDDAKAGRARALKNMESMLFLEGDSGTNMLDSIYFLIVVLYLFV